MQMKLSVLLMIKRSAGFGNNEYCANISREASIIYKNRSMNF